MITTGQALGRAIAAMRAERGLSRRTLAELAGISYPYMSEVENGTKRMTVDRLMDIAIALNVGPSRILDYAQEIAAQQTRLEATGVK